MRSARSGRSARSSTRSTTSRTPSPARSKSRPRPPTRSRATSPRRPRAAPRSRRTSPAWRRQPAAPATARPTPWRRPSRCRRWPPSCNRSSAASSTEPHRITGAEDVPMKALVVDDSRAMRTILSQMLRSCGFEVGEAGHGRDALTWLESHADTELAIVDWNMPEMDGLQLLQALKADGRYASMRRMMVTTETEMTQISRALEAGADEYVMKPFTREVIEDKLRLMGLMA